MTDAAKKLNLPKRSDEYRNVPYRLFGAKIKRKNGNGGIAVRNPRFYELQFVGEVYSFSNMKNDPNAVCTRSYAEFQEAMGCSRSTVAKTLKTCAEAGFLSQKKNYHKSAEYRYEGEKGDEFFVTFERYLQERKFYIPREDCKRKLKPVEFLLVALLGAHCNKPGVSGCDFSVEELCEKTGYCEKEVRQGIKCLIGAGFLSLSETFDYIHKSRRRRFFVNKAVRLLMIHRPKPQENNGNTNDWRKPQSNLQNNVAESARAAEIRGERERYYAIWHERALDRAEEMKKKAEESADFKKAESELKECEFALARAEVYDPKKAASLRIMLEDIKERKKRALQAIGLTESDLLPKYECKKCSDTGFMKDGHMCDCYPYSERGSP